MKNTKSTSTKANTAKNTKTETKATKTAETKNAIDFLLETQTQLVDKFVDSSKKFFEVIDKNGNVEKARTFVNEWLEKQQGNLENASSTVKTQVKFDNAPELVKEVVAAQEELGKEWFEALRATAKTKDLAELNDILSANIKKLQDNVQDVSSYWMENFGKPVNFTEILTADYAKDVTKKLVDMWKPAKLS